MIIMTNCAGNLKPEILIIVRLLYCTKLLQLAAASSQAKLALNPDPHKPSTPPQP